MESPLLAGSLVLLASVVCGLSGVQAQSLDIMGDDVSSLEAPLDCHGQSCHRRQKLTEAAPGKRANSYRGAERELGESGPPIPGSETMYKKIFPPIKSFPFVFPKISSIGNLFENIQTKALRVSVSIKTSESGSFQGIARSTGCYMPRVQLIHKPSAPCSPESTCGNCRGSCSSNSDCNMGLVCTSVRAGCEGSSAGNGNYCQQGEQPDPCSQKTGFNLGFQNSNSLCLAVYTGSTRPTEVCNPTNVADGQYHSIVAEVVGREAWISVDGQIGNITTFPENSPPHWERANAEQPFVVGARGNGRRRNGSMFVGEMKRLEISVSPLTSAPTLSPTEKFTDSETGATPSFAPTSAPTSAPTPRPTRRPTTAPPTSATRRRRYWSMAS